MQQALVAPASPLRLSTPFESKAFPFSDQRLSSSHYLSNGDDLFYGYSSPSGPSLGLSSPSPLVTSSLSPSSAASVVDDGDEGAAANSATTDHRLHLARLALQYQEVADRYELCLSHLADAADEAAALRRENAELRVAYTDLARRLATISGKQSSAVAIADEIHRLRLGEQQATKERRAAAAEKLAVLPKSISIRSGGYLKMCQAAATPGGRNGKLRASNPANIGSQQRVYVGMGGKKGEDQNEQLKGGLELEAYNQGMVKTELCNKWEETGSCPFGDQCQFAHGVAELRPVIRHPRYKTAVCRMVLAGGACPYGHRCHFRHSLTPSDRLLLRP